MTTPLQQTEAPQQTQVADVNSLIMEWYSVKQQADELTKKERELRQAIDQSQLFDASKTNGTQNYDLGRGYKLKLVRRENVNVANKNYEAAHAIVALRNLGPVEAERANEIFKFDARLSETTYRKLTPAELAIVDPLITRKPGSPSVELVLPKE